MCRVAFIMFAVTLNNDALVSMIINSFIRTSTISTA